MAVGNVNLPEISKHTVENGILIDHAVGRHEIEPVPECGACQQRSATQKEDEERRTQRKTALSERQFPHYLEQAGVKQPSESAEDPPFGTPEQIAYYKGQADLQEQLEEGKESDRFNRIAKRGVAPQPRAQKPRNPVRELMRQRQHFSSLARKARGHR